MIRKLRRKFIWVSMLSVTVVLLVLLLGINIANAIRVDQKADEVLDLLLENEGNFPPDNFIRPRPNGPHFSAEMPFETRFFSVLINSDNKVVRVNTMSIAAVTESQAVEYAESVLESEDDEGYIDVYKYRVKEDDGGTLFLFLDRDRELSTLTSFFFTSFYIFLIGTAAIFLLILLLSRRVIRPVAESYERQTQFITDASHELKTPLTIIDANAEVLELECGETEWTASIKNQVTRLATLTDALTALCRAEEMKHTLQAVDFSLSDAVCEALEPFNAPAALKEQTLTTNIDAAITFQGDERAIRQLVTLLADNAVKYTPVGGEICFTLKQNGKRHTLICRNTANGITPGNHDRLFERFYRNDPSRSSTTGGSGIGLSIVKAIVASLDGNVTAYSEDGTFLTVVVSF